MFTMDGVFNIPEIRSNVTQFIYLYNMYCIEGVSLCTEPIHLTLAITLNRQVYWVSGPTWHNIWGICIALGSSKGLLETYERIACKNAIE